MMQETLPNDVMPIEALRIICSDIKECGRKLGVYEADGTLRKEHIILHEDWSEIAPNVYIKAMFPDDSKKFEVKAKAGSLLEVYEALSERKIFVAYGTHENVFTGEIYKTGDSYNIDADELHGMKFETSSRLIVEIY